MLITGIKQKVFFGETAVLWGAVVGSLRCPLGHPACCVQGGLSSCETLCRVAVLTWCAVFCRGRRVCWRLHLASPEDLQFAHALTFSVGAT